MAISDDFTVNTSGDIRHDTGSSHYTVLELHRFLQDLADDAQASGNDLVDITTSTPSERSTDNIITLLGSFNIDDVAAEYFYDGSITQSSGDTVYSGLKVLGAVNNANTQIQVIQDNALYDGAAPFWGDQSTGGYNGNAAAGILMRCLIKSRDAGEDIDGKRIRVQSRHWGDTYDFFNVTLGVGESVAAIGTTPDAQNTTARGTIAGYTHIENTEGYQTINLNEGSGATPYYSQWDYTSNDSGTGLKGTWQKIKEMSGNTTGSSLHGINGELFLGITHEYAYDSSTGNAFAQNDIITWGSGATAGSGLLLAEDTAGSTIWMQLLKGVAPTNTLTVTNGAEDGTHDLNGAPTTRTVPKVFLGSYTGTVIGAFGIGFSASNLTAQDSVQNLLGDNITPPNNVTFTVSGLEETEDYVLVGPKAAGNVFKFDQLINASALTGAAETAIYTSGSIPADTPSIGTVRIQLDTGIYRRVPYTGWAACAFAIDSTDFTDPNDSASGTNIMISYIDALAGAGASSLSFTGIYEASRPLWIRVRDGGTGKGDTPIKTFESQGTLGAAGGAAVAGRITDA
jgi:hypothetical protein